MILPALVPGFKRFPLFLLWFGLSAGAWPVVEGSSRIVAIGDVHGDFEVLTGILKEAAIIDSNHRWSGGDATLVLTGDFLDRGADIRPVMDLLMALEKEAPRRKGRVEVLLGNHEVMNLTGGFRDVNPAAFAAFADKSEKRRLAAADQYLAWKSRSFVSLEDTAIAEERSQWLQTHPPGFLEYQDAFGRHGEYGKWLRMKSIVLQIGDTIFLHGGIHPSLATMSLESFNERIGQELQAFENYREYLIEREVILPFFTFAEMIQAAEAELRKVTPVQEPGTTVKEPSRKEKQHLDLLQGFLRVGSWLSFHPDGPLWFRGYAQWSDEEGMLQMESLRSAYQARHFVVGHTPQTEDGIRMRFQSGVFLIDTAMSRAYPMGRPSALEIKEGRFTAVYLDEDRLLYDPRPNPDPTAFTDSTAGQTAPEVAFPVRPSSLNNDLPAWAGIDGHPLPFRNEQEVCEFLRQAAVISSQKIGEGINNPLRVLLEKDGVRAQAVFRDVSVFKHRTEVGARTEFNFRDDAIFECAAYQLAALLGLNLVPPAVERTILGKKGSLQLWIENAMTEKTRLREKLDPPDKARWFRQMQLMHLFDSLIYNDDRNQGNFIYDSRWNMWWIDHTRSFRNFDQLKEPALVRTCERQVWERLTRLTDEELKSGLRPWLRVHEITALLKRRRKLIEHLKQRIADMGEARVIWTWQPNPETSLQEP